MGLFDKLHDEIQDYLAREQKNGKVTQFTHTGKTNWPISKNRNLVLGQDTAVELGNPQDASTSFLVWRNEPEKINNGRITIVGPDLPQVKEDRVSFGKIVMIGADDFDPDNSYERHRKLEQVRYNIHLKGYMMRGTSQYMQEWSRVSKEAMDNGFSLQTLGGALIDKFSELDFVRSVEVIFITAGRDDVLEMKTISDKVSRLTGAMNKMAEEMEEMSVDCSGCEFTDVCSDVEELRSMRKSHGK
jgi:CO dehydrogenase/acetyl-CoA synthase beta subunit